MPEKRRLIDMGDVRVAAPCSESWEDMHGDDRMRHCEKCELSVYNLSAMTEPEARELIEGTEGRLCVRFFKRADGRVLTRDCPVGVAARAKRRLRGIAAALLALIGFLPGCGGRSSDGPPPPSTQTVETPEVEPSGGETCPPPRDPAPLLGEIVIEPRELVGRIALPPVDGGEAPERKR